MTSAPQGTPRLTVPRAEGGSKTQHPVQGGLWAKPCLVAQTDGQTTFLRAPSAVSYLAFALFPCVWLFRPGDDFCCKAGSWGLPESSLHQTPSRSTITLSGSLIEVTATCHSVRVLGRPPGEGRKPRT